MQTSIKVYFCSCFVTLQKAYYLLILLNYMHGFSRFGACKRLLCREIPFSLIRLLSTLFPFFFIKSSQVISTVREKRDIFSTYCARRMPHRNTCLDTYRRVLEIYLYVYVGVGGSVPMPYSECDGLKGIMLYALSK